jgi:hypothetical protein
LVATVFGQLGYVLASYYLGAEIAAFTDRFLGWLSEHVVAATAACVAAVGLQLGLRVRRKARARRGRVDPPRP